VLHHAAAPAAEVSKLILNNQMQDTIKPTTMEALSTGDRLVIILFLFKERERERELINSNNYIMNVMCVCSDTID